MMENLLERTAHADANELIDIVDELRIIEHELGLVSEDAMEAFEMEEEVGLHAFQRLNQQLDF